MLHFALIADQQWRRQRHGLWIGLACCRGICSDLCAILQCFTGFVTRCTVASRPHGYNLLITTRENNKEKRPCLRAKVYKIHF